jgi:hypothetical protein
MKIVAALVLGASAGALAAISHAALFPVGLILAVAGSFAIVRLVGLRTGSRVAVLVAALAWVAVILRASISGFAGELLIWDSTQATLFLVLGSLGIVVAALLPPARS